MKNNKGFTLVEIISVITLLALIIVISVPIVTGVSKNIKKSTLNTKIDNIEKAAVLYGQEHRENFTNEDVDTCIEKYCPKNSDNTIVENCECYKENNSTVINVIKLLEDGFLEEDGYTVDIDGNKQSFIINSYNETETLNNCEIQIYQKYGKIYAIYNKEKNKSTCWYED